MTLSTNPLGDYIPNRKMKCPTNRHVSVDSIDRPPTHRRRRVTVDSARPSATSFQMHQGRLPRRSSCPNLKKNVSFCQPCHVSIDRHGHDNNLAAVEQWYSEEDHLRFKIDRTVDVRSFRKHSMVTKEVATSSLCPVGIEQFLSSKGAEDAKLNRRLVIKTVLLEQTRQRALGFRDPDQLASLAAQVTTESMKFAQKRGKFQEMSKFV